VRPGESASIRALFLITSLERGGSEGQFVELLSRIHPAPVDATVATVVAARDGRHTERLRACDIRHIVLAPAGGSAVRRWGAAALRLEGLLRRLRPDVVYVWGEYPSLVAVPLARLRRVPVVVARRNSGNASLPRGLDRAARWVEARAGLVTVNSAAALKEAARHGVSRGRLRVVCNGHDGGRPSPAPTGGEVRLGYVAGLRPGKGHRQLLQALPAVRAKSPWCIELAGTGPLLRQLRTEVHERGLAERVRFVGLVDDIVRFWQEHHACLLLSASEGSSNALIEAGLAGRPLVVTDAPGNRELVTPGTGLLVRAEDVPATARTLEQIIDDAQLREELGRGAAEAMRRFETGRMVAGHLDALAECLASAPSG
jgi:glycosyltransferase involved in cell wall biosynthesis